MPHPMITNYLFLAIPQWGIFAALIAMAYGRTEKKRIFGLVGCGILFLLGLYAAAVLGSGVLVPEQAFLDAAGTEDEMFQPLPDEIPLEGRLIPVYWGLAVNALPAALALAAGLLRKRIAGIIPRKAAGILRIIAGLAAILLFFATVAVVRN